MKKLLLLSMIPSVSLVGVSQLASCAARKNDQDDINDFDFNLKSLIVVTGQNVSFSINNFDSLKAQGYTNVAIDSSSENVIDSTIYPVDDDGNKIFNGNITLSGIGEEKNVSINVTLTSITSIESISAKINCDVLDFSDAKFQVASDSIDISDVASENTEVTFGSISNFSKFTDADKEYNDIYNNSSDQTHYSTGFDKVSISNSNSEDVNVADIFSKITVDNKGNVIGTFDNSFFNTYAGGKATISIKNDNASYKKNSDIKLTGRDTGKEFDKITSPKLNLIEDGTDGWFNLGELKSDDVTFTDADFSDDSNFLKTKSSVELLGDNNGALSLDKDIDSQIRVSDDSTLQVKINVDSTIAFSTGSFKIVIAIVKNGKSYGSEFVFTYKSNVIAPDISTQIFDNLSIDTYPDGKITQDVSSDTKDVFDNLQKLGYNYKSAYLSDGDTEPETPKKGDKVTNLSTSISDVNKNHGLSISNVNISQDNDSSVIKSLEIDLNNDIKKDDATFYLCLAFQDFESNWYINYCKIDLTWKVSDDTNPIIVLDSTYGGSQKNSLLLTTNDDDEINNKSLDESDNLLQFTLQSTIPGGGDKFSDDYTLDSVSSSDESKIKITIDDVDLDNGIAAFHTVGQKDGSDVLTAKIDITFNFITKQDSSKKTVTQSVYTGDFYGKNLSDSEEVMNSPDDADSDSSVFISANAKNRRFCNDNRFDYSRIIYANGYSYTGNNGPLSFNFAHPNTLVDKVEFLGDLNVTGSYGVGVFGVYVAVANCIFNINDLEFDGSIDYNIVNTVNNWEDDYSFYLKNSFINSYYAYSYIGKTNVNGDIHIYSDQASQTNEWKNSNIAFFGVVPDESLSENAPESINVDGDVTFSDLGNNIENVMFVNLSKPHKTTNYKLIDPQTSYFDKININGNLNFNLSDAITREEFIYQDNGGISVENANVEGNVSMNVNWDAAGSDSPDVGCYLWYIKTNDLFDLENNVKNISVNSYEVGDKTDDSDIEIVNIPQFYGGFTITVGDDSNDFSESTNTSGPRTILTLSDLKK